MARYCSDCTFFNSKDKKDGVEGYCKCSKIKKNILANTPACEKFERAYSRKAYDCEKLYDSAKEAEKKSTGKDMPVIIPIILIIAIIVLKLLKIM